MTPSRHLLYTYRRCPYAMRARMALLLAGVVFEAHEVVLRDKPAAMLRTSPKGTVPVLVLSDGGVLEQSWDIVEWALTHEGARCEVRGWWSRAQTPENLELLRCNDGEFKHHLDRYKYPERFTPEPADIAAIDARVVHRDQAMATLLERLEHRLGGSDFLGGTEPCATDFCIFPFVRQFAAIDPVWFNTLGLRHVKTWLARWLQSPLFGACMQKFPSNAIVPYPRLSAPKNLAR